MITAQESRKDCVSEQEFAEREKEIKARRKDLASQAYELDVRAKELRAELEALDPLDEANIDLTDRLENIVEDIAWVRYGVYQLVADALAVVDDDGGTDYRYTPADIKAWCDRALEMGASHPQLPQSQICDLMRMRQVPNAPFRERLEELLEKGEQYLMGVTFSVHAHLRRIEQEDGAEYGAKNLIRESGGRVNAQTRIVERMLGMKTVEGNTTSLRLFITYEQGVAFTRALDMSLQEAGL